MEVEVGDEEEADEFETDEIEIPDEFEVEEEAWAKHGFQWVKPRGEYRGVIYRVADNGNSLVRSILLRHKFGREPVIQAAEYPEPQLHDKVSFDVEPATSATAWPKAINVKVVGHGKRLHAKKGKGKG